MQREKIEKPNLFIHRFHPVNLSNWCTLFVYAGRHCMYVYTEHCSKIPQIKPQHIAGRNDSLFCIVWRFHSLFDIIEYFAFLYYSNHSWIYLCVFFSVSIHLLRLNFRLLFLSTVEPLSYRLRIEIKRFVQTWNINVFTYTPTRSTHNRKTFFQTVFIKPEHYI